MKLPIRILALVCILFFSVSAMSQEPTQTKTTTKTTVTTESEISTDTTAKQAPSPQMESTPSSAPQEETSSASDWRGVHIGAVAQATFTDVKVSGADGALSTSYVVGYGGGGFIGYFFSRHAELRLEALYSSLAREIVKDGVKRNLNLSYMNFPLLFAFHTGYDKPVSFNITAGPQIGINTGSSLDGSGSDGIDTVQASIKVKPADIGIAYGAGVDFGLGPDKLVHLHIGFRGVYGIIDISDDNKTATTNNYYILDRSRLKTYSGYVGISYKF